MLIDAGGELDLKDSQGYTPLMVAASCCQSTYFEILLKAGARLNFETGFSVADVVLPGCIDIEQKLNSSTKSH